MNCPWLKKTVLVKDPAVEDYFVRLDPEPSFADYRAKHGDNFARWYETGRVVVMDQVPIDPNYDLLWNVEFPEGSDSLKKIKHYELLKPIQNAKHALVRIFGDETQLAEAFQKEVARITDILFAAAAQLFPTYKFLQEDMTWRFAVTHTEGLHFDVYDGVADLHVLRLFVNLDSFPRVWYLGDRLETVLSKYDIDESWGDDPNRWNERLTKEYGGDTFGYQPSSSPQHIALFAPGSMWIAHSQYVPHGPLFGRRMVALSIRVDPKSMHDPDLCFYNLPSRIRRVQC